MKHKLVSFIPVAALLLLLGGCATTSDQGLANLPPAKTPKEAAQRVVAYAAGYCKGMADKQGADFEVCFKQQTDLAMAKIEADAASDGAQAQPPK